MEGQLFVAVAVLRAADTGDARGAREAAGLRRSAAGAAGDHIESAARDGARRAGRHAGGRAPRAAVAGRRLRPGAANPGPAARDRPTRDRTGGESASPSGPGPPSPAARPRRWNGNHGPHAEREVHGVAGRPNGASAAPAARHHARGVPIEQVRRAVRAPPARRRTNRRTPGPPEPTRQRRRRAPGSSSARRERPRHGVERRGRQRQEHVQPQQPERGPQRRAARRRPELGTCGPYFSWNGYGVVNPSDGGKPADLTAFSTQEPVGVPANLPPTVRRRDLAAPADDDVHHRHPLDLVLVVAGLEFRLDRVHSRHDRALRERRRPARRPSCWGRRPRRAARPDPPRRELTAPSIRSSSDPLAGFFSCWLGAAATAVAAAFLSSLPPSWLSLASLAAVVMLVLALLGVRPLALASALPSRGGNFSSAMVARLAASGVAAAVAAPRRRRRGDLLERLDQLRRLRGQDLLRHERDATDRSTPRTKAA